MSQIGEDDGDGDEEEEEEEAEGARELWQLVIELAILHALSSVLPKP